jgi:pimeloyl-ACP methyl ester carboxylesterase
VLAKSYQLILVDNRGMGFSTANAEPFSYALYAADVLGLLDALGVKKAHVLGFSMGSTIAQQLLVDAPERIGKAVILATTVDGAYIAAALKGRTFDNTIVLRQLEATTRWRSPLDKLATTPNQVLLLVGTADTVVGTESSKTLAATIPGAWLVQFKNASHGLVLEMPNEFLRLVLTFLDTGEVVRGK